MTNCTGAQAQYPNMDSCKDVCAAFTAPGMLGDQSGDTLGCRIYHAGAPAVANPTLHCPHAGPTGGDKDPMGTAGVCGEPCTSFCSIAAKNCPTEYSTDGGMPQCMASCKAFTADTAAYSTALTSGNTMGCRFYHLSVASVPANAAMHCPHILPVSTACM
jgi:hypothetical protein